LRTPLFLKGKAISDLLSNYPIYNNWLAWLFIVYGVFGFVAVSMGCKMHWCGAVVACFRFLGVFFEKILVYRINL